MLLGNRAGLKCLWIEQASGNGRVLILNSHGRVIYTECFTDMRDRQGLMMHLKAAIPQPYA